MPISAIKRLTILFLLCFACLAQTQIVGPLNSASDDSLLFTGKIRLTWPPFVTADHHSVAPGFREIDVVGGVFNTSLWPTQGAGPITSYTVSYTVPGLPVITEKWGVPISASPVSIAALKSVTYASGAGFVILVSNVDASGLSDGCLNVVSGSIGSIGSPCGSGGGGGQPINTFTTVSFSSTPVFSLGAGNTTSKITLTGNVSSSTVIGATRGNQFTMIICQDSTGNHSFTWPSGFHGQMTIGLTANGCSAQVFVYDGSVFYSLSHGDINQ